MRKVISGVVVAALGLGFVAGLQAQARLVGPNDPNRTAGSGQSEIIIDAGDSTKDLAIFVNGTVMAHMFPGTAEKIIVLNGQNVIEAAETTANARTGRWAIGSKKRLDVNSSSSVTTVVVKTRYGALLSLAAESNYALGGGGAPVAVAPPAPRQQAPAPRRGLTNPLAGRGQSGGQAQGGLEGAVSRAVAALESSIPEGATLAVLSMASSDKDMAEFVIEEVVFLLVDARRYRVVDRRSLDQVRSEANFQLSGDVDDNSAVSIGKMLGASIVITGSIGGSGSTRRLRAKALNVQTAEIIAAASEAF
ncbi:MAG: CsgG/HfaB family protein [Treponema sp.]|nr:CsgG/HfaB family protein [Treponema sp.]